MCKSMQFLNYNPYSYNAISLKNSRYSVGGNKEPKVTKTKMEVVADPTSNHIGHMLGIHGADWDRFYPDVDRITQWAKDQVHSNKIEKIVEVITEKLNSVPSMNERRIVDLTVALKLEGSKDVKSKTESTSKEQVVHDPLTNSVAKYFGITTPSEMSKYYDRISDVVKWGKEKSKSDKLPEIMETIKEKLNTTPSLNDKRIVDLHLATKLDQPKKETEVKENGEV